MTQPERKTTVPQEISTRPEATYATKSAVTGVTNQGQIKTTPSHSQAAKPAFIKASNPPTVVKRKSDDHLQHGVVVKKSTHVPADIPKGAWHTDVERTMPMATARHTNVERTITVQSTAANSRANDLAPNANMPSSNLEVTGAASRNLPTSLDINCNAEKTEADLNNRQGATCVRPDVRNLNVQLYRPHTSWACAFCSSQLETLLELTAHIHEKHRNELFLRGCEPRKFQTEDPRLAQKHQRPQSTVNGAPEIPESCRGEKVPKADVPSSALISTHMSSARPRDQDSCNPYCRRPCQIHNMEPSSSDDEELNGLEQVTPTAQRIGSLNFPPLNLQYQSQGNNNNAKPANPAADPANPAKRKALKKATAGRVRPEAIMFDDATAADAYADAYDTPREIVTLAVEDIPVVVDGEGCICITCYEIIPEPQYASHRRCRDCHSPARPPEAERDNLSCIAY